jgi:predicted nucleic-acid-binding protein
MLAVDSNIIVRFLTRDHPDQSPRARTLVDDNDTFVSRTVLLETEWVLRSVYGYDRNQVFEALTSFAGLPRVVVEDAAGSLEALHQMKRGCDFADALHIASAGNCRAFVTFDQSLVKMAARAAGLTVRVP